MACGSQLTEVPGFLEVEPWGRQDRLGRQEPQDRKGQRDRQDRLGRQEPQDRKGQRDRQDLPVLEG
jgi:hypothetical protein